MQSARVRALSTRFDAWVAALDAEALDRALPGGQGPRLPAPQGGKGAAHQMDEGQESLYAELALTGARHGIACTAM